MGSWLYSALPMGEPVQGSGSSNATQHKEGFELGISRSEDHWTPVPASHGPGGRAQQDVPAIGPVGVSQSRPGDQVRANRSATEVCAG
jgi:hypothetical protein